VTPEMVDHADRADRLPHYPHIDMAETGRSGREASRAIAEHQAALRKAFPSVAVPDSDQLAMHQRSPTKGIYEELARWRATQCRRCLFAPGFPARIFFEVAGLVYCYGRTQAEADAAADQIAALVQP